ncbi:MAG: YajQ family cyclic di-GMP-binding protein [Xanthomonadales bacterium]|nr:YajQ family cyclic di-GMP-binding protein [Xanthomonadales bacterium]
MPSFDVVSEIDHHELTNAVDQANREVATRFDFKGSGANFELDGNQIALHAQVEFQLQQMLDMLYNKLAKRGIDVAALEVGDPVIMANTATQSVTVREGIDTPLAKDIVKRIKASKIKVQATIQGEQVRVTGKKRDDLQAVIALLKEADLGVPLQFKNFRD